uniref:ribosomal protein S3 n=1 Tax=Meteora sporadica TaxID=2913902 RepID=UPI0030012FC6|nr:ribosomal protein S3 [Meteora sporadica]WVH37090.1 ribosomal protein S3 [Meteora sporadica]
MSRRVHPVSFRLRYLQNWHSLWCTNKKYYAKLLHEDLLMRKYIMLKLFKRRLRLKKVNVTGVHYDNKWLFQDLFSNATYFFLATNCVHSCNIKRLGNKIFVYIHLTKYFPKEQSRHFTIKLRRLNKQITFLKKVKKSKEYKDLLQYKRKLTNIEKRKIIRGQQQRDEIYHNTLAGFQSVFEKFTGKDVYFSVVEHPLVCFVNPSIISQYVSKQLELNSMRIRWILKEVEIRLKKDPIVKGYKITCSGRFGGKNPRTQKYTVQGGILPLNTIDSYIDYSQSFAVTKSGVCGIKVWVHYMSPKVYPALSVEANPLNKNIHIIRLLFNNKKNKMKLDSEGFLDSRDKI